LSDYEYSILLNRVGNNPYLQSTEKSHGPKLKNKVVVISATMEASSNRNIS